MPGYSKSTKPRDADAEAKDAYERTVTRLNRLAEQVASAPRGKSLAGKVCIITGVGSLKGIGRATALLYAREGAKHLYLLDFVANNLPNLASTISNEYNDVQVTTVQADAADDYAIKALCERAIREEGRLDVFFANAGVATGKSIQDTPAEEWDKIMHTNTLSTFLAVKYGSKAMTVTSSEKPLSDGSIIMTASVAGIRSGAGSAEYSASKAAVISLAKTGAHQLGPHNIRVNSISPGLIETGMTADTFEYARSRGTAGKIGQLSAMQRFGVADEVAAVALFLASDSSSYITGQNIPIDGGLSAMHPYRPGKLA